MGGLEKAATLAQVGQFYFAGVGQFYIGANSLVGAMLLEQNDEWSLQRRYMQLEGLQSLSDNQPARLSAVIS